MKKQENETSIEVVESTGNVFADLGLPEPEEHLIKAELARKINRLIAQQALTQIQAAWLLGVDQPKISAISRGQLSGFSLERLIGFLTKLDQDVQILISPKPAQRPDHGHLQVAFA